MSLIPKAESESSYECDCIAFKSSKDINSYIGDEFDFLNFYNKDLLKQIESSSRELDSVDDEEKYMVYVYPNHKSMMSILERGSNIKLYDKEVLKYSFKLPEGGILNIVNNESEEIRKTTGLEVKLITNKIEN